MVVLKQCETCEMYDCVIHGGDARAPCDPEQKSIIVTVYEDPLTRLVPEGDALLVAEYGERNIDWNKMCTVRFLDDPPDMLVTRWVHVGEIAKGKTRAGRE